MCLEDLLFMKLGRWSPEDLQDIEAIITSGAQIDFELLDYLVHDEEESRGAGMSDRAYSELLCAYGDFLRRIDENGWSV